MSNRDGRGRFVPSPMGQYPFTGSEQEAYERAERNKGWPPKAGLYEVTLKVHVSVAFDKRVTRAYLRDVLLENAIQQLGGDVVALEFDYDLIEDQTEMYGG